MKSFNVKELSLNSPHVQVPVELLETGDFVLVKPGDGIPTDGVVVFGRGMCNETLLTGQSYLISKQIASKVFGGTTLNQGSFIFKVTRTVENATYS